MEADQGPPFPCLSSAASTHPHFPLQKASQAIISALPGYNLVGKSNLTSHFDLTMSGQSDIERAFKYNQPDTERAGSKMVLMKTKRSLLGGASLSALVFVRLNGTVSIVQQHTGSQIHGRRQAHTTG